MSFIDFVFILGMICMFYLAAPDIAKFQQLHRKYKAEQHQYYVVMTKPLRANKSFVLMVVLIGAYVTFVIADLFQFVWALLHGTDPGNISIFSHCFRTVVFTFVASCIGMKHWNEHHEIIYRPRAIIR